MLRLQYALQWTAVTVRSKSKTKVWQKYYRGARVSPPERNKARCTLVPRKDSALSVFVSRVTPRHPTPLQGIIHVPWLDYATREDAGLT